jgi:hypothetical protein
MKVSRREWLGALTVGTAFASLGGAAEAKRKEGKVEKLFNGKNLDGWYVSLRDPDKKQRAKNEDPEGIFKVEHGMIHVLGKEFGYAATDKEYGDFHLTVEYKWGQQKFAPRNKPDSKRDSGILYRFPDGEEDRVWPKSIECQVQEGDTGDLWLVNGTTIVAGGEKQDRFFKKTKDAEKPNDQWNRVEVIADGGRCLHVVNGIVVNEGTEASVRRGRILLQSEGAEVFYRKVELRPLA